MALEYICSNEIMKGKRIFVPGGANCFRTKSGKIKFFKVNLEEDEKIKKIFLYANEISFDKLERHAYHLEYGKPTFYDAKGNILK